MPKTSEIIFIFSLFSAAVSSGSLKPSFITEAELVLELLLVFSSKGVCLYLSAKNIENFYNKQKLKFIWFVSFYNSKL